MVVIRFALYPVVGLLVILCIWKRDKQPLKSRGLIPYMILAAETLSLTTLIVHNTSLYQHYDQYWLSRRIMCFIIQFFVMPAYMTMFTMVMLQTIRYIAITNINSIKNSVLEFDESKDEEVKDDNMRRRFKIFKRLTSNWMIGVLVLIQWTVWYVFDLIIFATRSGFNGNCDINTPTFSLWMAMAATLFILAVLVVIVDYAVNIKNKTVSWKSYLTRGDPLLFRIEFIVFFLVVCIMVVLLALAIITSGFSSNRLANFDIHYITLVSGILFLMVEPGIVLIATFKREWDTTRGKKSKETGQEDLVDKLMHNKQLKALFKEFAKREWSQENVSLWSEIGKYEKAKGNDKKKKAIALKIYNMYLSPDSYCEVNTTGTIKDDVKKAIESDKYDDDLFVPLKDDVKVNLIDTYSR